MEKNYHKPIAEIFQIVDSSASGLSSAEAASRLKKFGPNVYGSGKKKTWFSILISQFKDPIIILLLLVVGISFFTEDHINSIVIIVMVGINTLIGFTQGFRAHKSLERLKSMIKLSVKKLKDGKITITNSTEIVVGDVILLNKGDIIPADARIISAQDLYVNEASLTGESLPVNKDDKDHKFKTDLPQYITNYLFQGTSISDGSARAVVTATGKNTILGKSVTESDENLLQSNYAKNIKKFSQILFYSVIIIVLVAFAINLYLGRGILNSLILGITLAMGLTPETMPLIISIALSSAAHRLSKDKVLIKRLSVFEDFGNVDTICADKTGTITMGILEVEKVVDTKGENSELALLYASICCSTNPAMEDRTLENTIDTNIWDYATNKHLVRKIGAYNIAKVWDLDFTSRTISVLASTSENNSLLIAKGASEEILNITNITELERSKYISMIKQYEEEGSKVIVVAAKKYTGSETIPKDRKNFKNLEVIGFVLLKDQPRKDVASELKKLAELNISLKIITGDSANVTTQICDRVGLDIVDGRIITGDILENTHDKSTKALDEMVQKYNVFARINPLQKVYIIESLKRCKHVVAYLGDGINDVGALKSSDVGIAVNTAVDVAKDSADVIILNRKLTTIAKGIQEGRCIFANTMKFIFSTMSSSFGNVVTIVFASLFLKFLPLLPAQIILLDSLSDLQHLAISTDKVDSEIVEKPRNWNLQTFIKYVIYWGIISTIFDFILIFITNHLSASPDIFRSVWLLESLITEILATFALRTHKVFYKSTPGKLMVVFSLIPLVLMGVISYVPFTSEIFGLQGPSTDMLLIILVMVSMYFATLEITKKGYFKEFWGMGKIA